MNTFNHIRFIQEVEAWRKLQDRRASWVAKQVGRTSGFYSDLVHLKRGPGIQTAARLSVLCGLNLNLFIEKI